MRMFDVVCKYARPKDKRRLPSNLAKALLKGLFQTRVVTPMNRYISENSASFMEARFGGINDHIERVAQLYSAKEDVYLSEDLELRLPWSEIHFRIIKQANKIVNLMSDSSSEKLPDLGYGYQLLLKSLTVPDPLAIFRTRNYHLVNIFNAGFAKYLLTQVRSPKPMDPYILKNPISKQDTFERIEWTWENFLTDDPQSLEDN